MIFGHKFAQPFFHYSVAKDVGGSFKWFGKMTVSATAIFVVDYLYLCRV